MIQILGFTPDIDATTPGVITDCAQLLPSEVGMRAAPSAVVPTGVGPLADACAGASVLSDLTSVRRVLAGTSTALYELTGSTWTDVSRGSAYTSGADSRWTFEQFGNSAIAVNGADVVQRSTGGEFADIAGAPVADIAVSAAGFLLVLNFNDGTLTPDGWYCSALYDETDWALDVSTQATQGRLVSSEGKITAGKRLGNYVVAYKEKALYLGQYVGAPVVWQWDQMIGGDAGCSGKEAVVDVGGAHFFVNDSGFWAFDGTRPVPIGSNQVRKWWLDNSDPSYRFRTIASHDKQNNLVWFYYCSSDSGGVLDSAIVYHLVTKQWGRADREVEAALHFVSPGVTIDDLDTYSATIDGLPPVSYDSQFWLRGGKSQAVFDTVHQLRQMTGPAENSSLTTGDFGDDDAVTMLRKVRPRFARAPVTGQGTFSRKFVEGSDALLGGTTSLVDGRFPAAQKGRWHRVRMDFTGPMTVTGYQPELVLSGKR